MSDAERAKQRSEDQARALIRATVAWNNRAEADAEYESAVMDAWRKGVRPTTMAKTFGISETSVRLYIKRHKNEDDQ